MPAKTTTCTPMMATSSMEACFKTRETATKLRDRGSTPSAPVVPPAMKSETPFCSAPFCASVRRKAAASKSTAMSRTVRAIMNTLIIMKAKMQVNSPWCSQPRSARMQLQRLTSVFTWFPSCNLSSIGFSTAGNGPLGSTSMASSSRRPRQGMDMPTARRPAKPRPRAAANAKMPSRPTSCTAHGFGLLPAASWGSPGRRNANVAMVEPTQKRLKQVKPTSRCEGIWMSALRSSRSRKRNKSNMYANMSGHAHFEMNCTTWMHTRALWTRSRSGLRRHDSPTAKNISLMPGMTTA
mmetsp:Transcript_70/g.195  ORF Transcript_70/g.195 Transcript_70/m.195 type:complete len:295 (+) Transcript_70:372-1256(+)